MSKRKNPFYFGQKVMCPHASASRIITEVVSDTRIRVIDLVELTPAQKADWGRTPVKGEFKFVPGLVIDIEGVRDWAEYMRESVGPELAAEFDAKYGDRWVG